MPLNTRSFGGEARVEGADILQTIAEVAIALTGFTGIVVALGDRSGVPVSGFALVRFQILLVASLAALAFALLPFLLHHNGVDEGTSWSISSALAVAFMIPIAISDVRSFREYGDEIPEFERRAAPAIGILGTSVLFSQIANAAYFHAFGLFLAVPVWFLGFSALSFSRLLFTRQSHSRQ